MDKITRSVMQKIIEPDAPTLSEIEKEKYNENYHAYEYYRNAKVVDIPEIRKYKKSTSKKMCCCVIT